jgi:hypothetical protein
VNSLIFIYVFASLQSSILLSFSSSVVTLDYGVYVPQNAVPAASGDAGHAPDLCAPLQPRFVHTLSLDRVPRILVVLPPLADRHGEARFNEAVRFFECSHVRREVFVLRRNPESRIQNPGEQDEGN